jgi:hypothetical protein
MDETWNNLDEKAWMEKYAALPQRNFKWKTPWMNNSSCIMTCGCKIWVPLTKITCYIGYALELVTRQLDGIQYVLRTLGLPISLDHSGISRHWKRSNLLVKIDEDFLW